MEADIAGETPGLSAHAKDALEATRSFVHGYWADTDGLEQVRSELANVARRNPHQLEQSLAALQVVLQENYPDGTLARLVAWDANWPLEDPSDNGAKAFLTQVAGIVRDVIDSTTRQ